ncbi:MAG: GAF domain-containing protein [Proteobacteria bacterium]|nr:GAF domain-containing protein [Pseudomonadota bacterium]MBU4469127.1 GAF domain-containing protein [Pseudomonadota bacterium]MCG2752158.1 ATP-binding protein [Desulfobacteraceae bacterium]
MLINLFWLTNLILFAASSFSFVLKEVHRKFSLAVAQALLFLPLLVVEYLAVALNMVPDPEGFTILLTSQNLFLVIWSTAARRLNTAMSAGKPEPTIILNLLQGAVVFLILGISVWQVLDPSFEIIPDAIRFPRFGTIYFVSLLCLLVMLFMAWQLEAFWRQLPKPRRREYGVFVVGSALVCAVQGGVASYRLTYLELANDILFLQAVFLLISWMLLVFAVLRHRLLNRNLFISRKIVYSSVAPALFATYFLLLGTVSFVIRLFGYPLEWVLFWFLLGIGGLAMAILGISEPVRQRLKFFISTHFYVNKYEYRDEWLAFSTLLQKAANEAGVLGALRQILAESLYTLEIRIWSGTEDHGFGLMVSTLDPELQPLNLTPDDPIIRYLRLEPRLIVEDPILKQSDTLTLRIASLPPPRPVLFVPLVASGQLVGCIGLGREYTGGRYGRDDFDLLAALGSQAASALLAVRLTEETARLREQRALNNLSAFLIHDIKNAASILSMVHANAKTHLDNPDFRKDMHTAIHDALQRMNKVQASLGLLRDRIKPVLRNMDLRSFLEDLLPRFSRLLPGLGIVFDCPEGITLNSDPQMLGTVMENLLLNAYEAGDGSSQVQITAIVDDPGTTITVSNTGPAIPGHLLPDRLFQPFVSDKPGGSGIGLWQARVLLQHLGATLIADNPETGGARFVIRFSPSDPSSDSVDSSPTL